jgi:hypothetical protein
MSTPPRAEQRGTVLAGVKPKALGGLSASLDPDCGRAPIQPQSGSGNDDSKVRGQELLVATGRAPVTADLGLEAAGVQLTDRGFVAVDEQLRTSADHVWAAGDVAGSPQFTHASWNDFRVIKSNLTGGNAVTTGRLVPYTVFTTPELARVGLTETEARAKGYDVRIARIDVASIPRTKTLHNKIGAWKAVINAQTDRILGVALFGDGSGEVVSAVQMAMLGGLRYPAGARRRHHPSHDRRGPQPPLRHPRRQPAATPRCNASSRSPDPITLGLSTRTRRNCCGSPTATASRPDSCCH